ncbi:helix-turn-helix transcriptional regulator [Enterococcus sp. DIV0876]|uniref:helix-turn-helix transcriptional regulator n=1 Tax=Enterococcus sp. DIV0876 TaxID=2774633 RepID=UPI003D300DFD
MEFDALALILKRLYHKYLIPLFVIDDTGHIIIPQHSDWTIDYLNQDDLTFPSNQMVFFYEDRDFFFCTFHCTFAHHKHCQVLVGPCGVLGTRSDTFTFHDHDYLAGVHYAKETQQAFVAFIELLYALLTGQVLNEDQHKWNYRNRSITAHTETMLTDNLYNRRSEDPFLDSFEFEKRYVEAVRRNESEKIEWLFQKANYTYNSELSHNKIEHLKYKYSGLITILTRVSVNEGVPVNQAYSLSDSLIQKLQKIHTIPECMSHIKETSLLFMALIHDFPYAETNFLVRDLLNYIDAHIYERITLKDLAASVQKHPTHITAEFKKALGQTVHTYINQKKVAEAKHLLLFTDKSYKEIANLLNFSSQSHFIQIFKQFENLTPLAFKNKHVTTIF